MLKTNSTFKWLIAGGAIVVIIFAILLIMRLTSPTPTFKVIKEAPEFEMMNYTGDPVSIENTNGKVRLVYFFFSNCPNVCQPTTYMLSKVQEELQDSDTLGTSTQLISVTFDPERDTAERLREYAGKFNADEQGWLFVNGDYDETLELAKEYGVMVQKLEGGDFAHTNAVFLVDRVGQVRKVYISDELDLDNAEDIAKDMIALSKQ